MYLFDALDLAAIDFIQVKMITAAKYVCPKHQTIYIINFNKTVCFYYDRNMLQLPFIFFNQIHQACLFSWNCSCFS